MYEMEGPRPFSRHRPADFSASFAPFNHLPGPGTRPVARSRPDRRLIRVFPVPWLGFPLCNQPGAPPSQAAPSISFSRWRRAARCHTTGVYPQAERPQVFPLPVAQSFLLITQLGVSPPPYKLKFAFAGGTRLSRRGQRPHVCPIPLALGFPETRGLRACPLPGGLGFPPHRWHQAFPGARGPRVCLTRGGSSFLFAGGAGLLLARRPGVILCRVARGFPFAGYRPWWWRISTPIGGPHKGFRAAISRFLAVHKPSTVNPGLSPVTGASPPHIPQAGPQEAAPRPRTRISPVPGSGRRT